MTASPVAGPRGFDGAKKVDGIKRHILVDTAGILVAETSHPGQRLDQPLPTTRPPQRSHPQAHEGFLYLSQIALLLRRLDRTQLFDTL